MTGTNLLRFPQFLGLGVQKGGTTTLQQLLQQHPQVWLSPKKELQFFSLHYHRGLQWYSDCFAEANSQQLCGDITPYYIFHPYAAARIASLLPAVRMIVLLRDPVERCLSQYFHSCRLGLESLDFQSALAAEPSRLSGAENQLLAAEGRHRGHQEHSYLARSRYDQQLEQYYHHFEPHQLLLLKSEDLFLHGPQVWSQILNFLGLDSFPFPEHLAPANAGRGESAGIPEQIQEQVRYALKPTYQIMRDTYGIIW